MKWNSEIRLRYQEFSKNYISTYPNKIDCADLAIATLVEFAKIEKLPIKFKYYSSGWQWISYTPTTDNANEFKQKAMTMLGALNVIDNTIKIPIAASKAGDFIMSRWGDSLGHTRVIFSVTPIKEKYNVVWYQGNLPAVKPEKREDLFSNIQEVFEQQPRRWNFEQFSN